MSDRGKDISTTRSKTDDDIEPKFTYEQLLSEIADIYEQEMARPVNSFTFREFIDAHPDTTVDKARAFLRKLLETNKIQVKKIGGINYYYR